MSEKVSRSTAEEIVAVASTVGTSLSDLGQAVRKIEDEYLRRAALQAVAELMIRVHEEIALPIIRIYPELRLD